MSKLCLIMGPMAGGRNADWGTEGLISPRYQGTAVINPISLFFCPEAGDATEKSVMKTSRSGPQCRISPLPVKLLEDGTPVLIVSDLIYSFNTGRIV